jgi:hypothetical protein
MWQGAGWEMEMTTIRRRTIAALRAAMPRSGNIFFDTSSTPELREALTTIHSVRGFLDEVEDVLRLLDGTGFELSNDHLADGLAICKISSRLLQRQGSVYVLGLGHHKQRLSIMAQDSRVCLFRLDMSVGSKIC